MKKNERFCEALLTTIELIALKAGVGLDKEVQKRMKELSDICLDS